MRRGFTLIELLVVVAIIGLLLAIMAPSFTAIMERADRDGCQNNHHQLATAVAAYASEYRGYYTFPNWLAPETRGDWTDAGWLYHFAKLTNYNSAGTVSSFSYTLDDVGNRTQAVETTVLGQGGTGGGTAHFGGTYYAQNARPLVAVTPPEAALALPEAPAANNGRAPGLARLLLLPRLPADVHQARGGGNGRTEHGGVRQLHGQSRHPRPTSHTGFPVASPAGSHLE